MLSIGVITRAMYSNVALSKEMQQSKAYTNFVDMLLKDFKTSYEIALEQYLLEVNATEKQKAANRSNLPQLIKNIEKQLDGMSSGLDAKLIPAQAISDIKSWLKKRGSQDELIRFTGPYSTLRAANFYLIRWWVGQVKDYTSLEVVQGNISILLKTNRFQRVHPSGTNRLTEQLNTIVPDVRCQIKKFNNTWFAFRDTTYQVYQAMLTDSLKAIIPDSIINELYYAKASHICGSDALFRAYHTALKNWRELNSKANSIKSVYQAIKESAEALSESGQLIPKVEEIYSAYLDAEELAKGAVRVLAETKNNLLIWKLEYGQEKMVDMFLKNEGTTNDYLMLFKDQEIELKSVLERLDSIGLPLCEQIENDLHEACKESASLDDKSGFEPASLGDRGFPSEIISSAPFVSSDAIAGAGLPLSVFNSSSLMSAAEVSAPVSLNEMLNL